MSFTPYAPSRGWPSRVWTSARRWDQQLTLDSGTAILPRLLLTVVPMLLIVGIGASTLWGHNGVFARAALEADAQRAAARLAKVDRENQRLLRDLALMETDPVVLERMVAEELLMARDGATLYLFAPDAEAR